MPESGPPRLTITAGTFVGWKDGRPRIANSADPFRLFELSPSLLGLVANLSRPRDLDSLLDGFQLEGQTRDKARSALERLHRGGILTTDDAPPDPADAANFRHAALEADRISDGYADITGPEPRFEQLYRQAQPYTFASVPMSYALHTAVKHIHSTQIPGAVVECGVWRGGSMLIAARTLLDLGDTERRLHLYDTFGWHWESPTEKDGFIGAESVTTPLTVHEDPAAATGTSVDEVLGLIAGAGYPREQVAAVKGLVQETIPGMLPGPIALLRLDTDLYDSTRHELEHLYPLLVSGGVLLLDDYGKLAGATRAVDEYFAKHGIRMLLNRIDNQGRIGIKP